MFADEILKTNREPGPEPGPGAGPSAALEAIHGQIDGFCSQLPCKCYLEEVACVGDGICPQLDSRVELISVVLHPISSGPTLPANPLPQVYLRRSIIDFNKQSPDLYSCEVNQCTLWWINRLFVPLCKGPSDVAIRILKPNFKQSFKAVSRVLRISVAFLFFKPQFLGKHKGEWELNRWPPTRK